MANPFEAAGYEPAKKGVAKDNPFAAAGFEAAEQAQSRDQMTHKAGLEGGTSAEPYGGPKGEVIYGPTTMEPGNDYYSGIPDAGTRYNLSRADNPAEQKAALEKRFGPNVYQDKFGNWMVKPEGFRHAGMKAPEKNTAVIPRKSNMSSAADWADYGGAAIPLAGGVAGAALTGGAGALPAIGGAMSGAAATKALDEIQKKLQGLHRKSCSQTAGEVGKEGLMAGAGEGGGRLLLGAKSALTRGPSMMASDAQKETFKDAAAHGYTPTLAQAIPSLRLASREQQMSHRIFSDPALKKNIESLYHEIEGFMKKSGTPEPDIPDAVERIATASTGDEKFGKILVDSVKRSRQGMELEAKKSRDQASLELSKQLGAVQKQITSKGTDAGAVRGAIVQAYDGFTQKAAEQYGALDQLAGKDLIPTQPLKDAAQQIQVMRQQTGGVVSDPEVDGIAKRISAMPDYVSARGMQQIRSRFGDKWFPQNMIKGLDDAERAQLFKGADESFELAVHQQAGSTEGGVLEGLRATDKWYKTELEKGKNTQVAALVKEAGERGAVDPGQVVDYLIKPGKGEQLGRVLKLLTPEARQNLAGAHFKSMVKESSDVTGEVNSKALRKRVGEMGPMLDQVYGKQDAALIRRYTDMLASYDGHLDPRELGGTHFAQILENAVRKEAQLESFMKDNYLHELSKGGAEASQAVDFVVKPNHPERVREAIKFFGADSKEVSAIRQQLMKKLFSEMFMQEGLQGSKQMSEFVSGKALKKAMAEYGNPTIEAAFGKEMASDMAKFADRVDYVSRSGGKAGELVSSNLALNWMHRKQKVFTIYALSKVMSSPKFMKYVVLGASEPQTAAGRAANKIVNEALLDAARGIPFGATPPFDYKRGQPNMISKAQGFLQ